MNRTTTRRHCRWGAAAIIVAFAVSPAWGQDNSADGLPLDELQLFAEIFGKIKNEYVDPVDDTTLLRNAIKGMLDGLDPHSTFLEKRQYQDIRTSSDGKFGGLGIEVTTEDGFIKVVTPIDDTPAYEAGLLSGDVITRLDGKSVQGMDLRQAVDQMRGKPGTDIEVTVVREGEEAPLEFTITRAVIRVTSVKGELMDEGFGYVRVSSFQADTAQALRTKIKRLGRDSGEPLRGVVLDLRNNPGGILGSAIEISDLFLESGVIVSTRGKDGSSDQEFDAKPGDLLNDAPLVVLVNQGSASASEIVAGALQDHQRALIIGTRTFGKGSVQTVVPMTDGQALKLTTARYYTPSNRSIQAKGIEPDIVVEQRRIEEEQSARKRIRESDLSGHLQNAETTNGGTDSADPPKSENRMTRRLRNDHQLKEALNVLKGMSLVKRRSSAG